MKKICITFAGILIIILSIFGIYTYFSYSTTTTEYLRVHIRANSNSEVDQNVKYKVRDSVVEFLTPYISNCNTKEEAINMLNSNLKNIENVADNVLSNNGFSYKAKASVKNEEFPTRTYENVTLESGFYDALILELGEGAGNNWWCVVYPPLCFVGSGNYVYKSKIKEIIDKFFK